MALADQQFEPALRRKDCGWLPKAPMLRPRNATAHTTRARMRGAPNERVQRAQVGVTMGKAL
eukprot:6408808-Alexandrium_andersonii.AAC.1